MINKISFKIGMLFFVFILFVEILLFVILYLNLANTQANEVMDNLLARGNTHRDVLEDHFNASTIDHVGMMESASDFTVVITDPNGNVIVDSNHIEAEMKAVIQKALQNPIQSDGEIISSNWKENQYIASNSIIMTGNEVKGHVFMFAETNKIKHVLNEMGKQFKLIGLLTFIITIVTIFILSKLITVPLIRMKKATENIQKEKGELPLDIKRKDELGVLARTIKELAEDLTHLKTERNEFLSSISHELRTPLTYIKGYADILSRREINKTDTLKYSTIIKEEAEQLSILIKNLFDLAKVDQHNFVINQEWILLDQIIQSVIRRMKPAFDNKNISVVVQCPENLKVYIDNARMQQVFINLLDNAQKHSLHNTSILLKVVEHKRSLEIIIQDEGEGIPNEEVPKVFNRLYRVEKSRSRMNGGSGIGLAITKEIIESHGGNIKMESELGKGTKVIITLPKDEK
ncbi:sensor histidine kinase [Gracilibacillus salinarum]|uniref:histidine kinase n=1 Tax=Gracilibacillus salinarum TaxID=2932255 RepID=A0ABY4GIC8_9BACI|nr:HAMP domain-containing sensor histidine kinase [Gracilibacillus salinarum]UOQ83974.1 HAMP domain-containing histidine kinase [Gracilibacillus salinarum]